MPLSFCGQENHCFHFWTTRKVSLCGPRNQKSDLLKRNPWMTTGQEPDRWHLSEPFRAWASEPGAHLESLYFFVFCCPACHPKTCWSPPQILGHTTWILPSSYFPQPSIPDPGKFLEHKSFEHVPTGVFVTADLQNGKNMSWGGIMTQAMVCIGKAS